MNDRKSISVGIAGLGRSGWNIHARCLSAPEQTARYEITAAADEIEGRCKDAQDKLGVKTYSDYRPMLKNGGFDVFINALPTHLHVPATLEALEYGYHVVCEKPFAPTVEEFDKVEQVAKLNDRWLFPFQNNRLQPFFDKMRAVIGSGVLGEIVHIRSTWGAFKRRWDWQTRQEYFGGSLFNTGPHAIDQALVLFGDSCEPEVFCRMDCNNELGGDADDFCTLTLFDPQRHAPTIDILLTSFLYYKPQYRYSVSGTTGTLVADADEIKWAFFDPEQAPEQTFWPHWSENRQYPSENLDFTEKMWRLDDQQFDQAVGYTLPSLPSGPARFYANIHEVINRGKAPLIKLSEVRRQVNIIEKCHRQNNLPCFDS